MSIKALILVFAAGLCVTLSLSIMSTRLVDRLLSEQLLDHSLVATEGIADHAAGPLRFNKVEKLQEEFKIRQNRDPERLTSLAAFDAAGARVTAAGQSDAAVQSQISTLVRQAIATGLPQRGESPTLLAVPVLFGPENNAIGAIATTWSGEHQAARVASEHLRSLAITAFVLAVSLAAAGLLFRLWVSNPLISVARTMSAVSDGELDVTVPHTARRDEVGQIARALDDQRQKLQVARETDMRAQDASNRAEAANEQASKKQEEQSHAVKSITQGLRALAAGDLTAELNSTFSSDYEPLRRDFNNTLSHLTQTVQSVQHNAESIRNGAEEISRASDDLSRRTESQAATLEESVAALEELTSSIKSSAEGAKNVEDIVLAARADADKSGEVVGNAIDAMTEIETSSNQVQQIISVIEDIAFQTNLLALNAGVEAARAGEAGKGFAVVATEVRALAQRSSEAALQIKTLIGGASQHVERGVKLVGKTGEALTAIAKQVSHISDHIGTIASSASEQSASLSEITGGMNQLDGNTQQNAAMVQEATAASHQLKTDAQDLSELVAQFKVDTRNSEAGALAKQYIAA